MNKPSGLASKLRALLKAKETPMWGVIIVLVIVIIFQQIQISELQWRVDEDHDGSTINSVAGRLYILEGMANKHGDQLDEVFKSIRLLVGSLAYLAIFGILLYLFFFKWIRKQEGLLSGFFTIFAGLLLIFEAYLVWKYGLDKSVLKGTMAQVVTDLTGFRTTSFAGGGLIGVALYIPTAFLFSNIGTYFIGSILILAGALLISPWSVYDIAEFFSRGFAKWREGHERRKEERFVKQEEKARQKAEEEARLEKEEAEKALLDMPPVDMETGEILTEDVVLDVPPVPEEEWVEPEIILPQVQLEAG